jgi:PAS domain S-box-containing protein
MREAGLDTRDCLEVSPREREAAEAAHRESEARFRALVEWSPVAKVVHRDGRVLYVNPAAVALFGAASADALVGAALMERVHPDFHQIVLDRVTPPAALGDQVPMIEERFLRMDGTPFDVEAQGITIQYDGGLAMLTAIRDITQRKAHEAEIHRLSRLYAALSQINQAIVSSSERDELFGKVCRILVEDGSFHMAWIGWHDPAKHSLVPVAIWGEGDEFLCGREIFVDGRPGSEGPVETAFARQRPHIINDVLSDPESLPRTAQLAQLGIHAVAVFPIREKGEVAAVMVVYADAPQFFQDKEIALLTEAALDVSFALDNFTREAERQEAVEKLRTSESSLANAQRCADRKLGLRHPSRRAHLVSGDLQYFRAEPHGFRRELRVVHGGGASGGSRAS